MQNFPDERSLRVLKSLNVDYVAVMRGLLHFSSSKLEYVSTSSYYDFYRLKEVEFDAKALFFIPPYAQFYAIKWKADKDCETTVKFQGREMKLILRPFYKTELFELDMNFFKVNPWEFEFQASGCKITVKETEFFRDEKSIDIENLAKLSFEEN
jgi:hypothetical protein